MPIFVRGTDAHGDDFLDLTRTIDISATGAFLACPRPLRRNELVLLTIPAPSPSSNGRAQAPSNPIQARVLRSDLSGDVHLIGVEFLKSIG